MAIFDDILKARGLTGERRQQFLYPDYDRRHDPFLLPDMTAAVERLVTAREKQERITIYGDYDIDGLTATTVLLDALESFGFAHVDAFIPNRFVEGYGLTVDAVERIAAAGAQLIITVDCGSLSTREIERANELGVDVIVTDHHNVQKIQPPAVAVINPKRLLQDFPEAYGGYVLRSPLPSSQVPPEPARRSLDAGPVDASAPSFEKSEILLKAGAAPRVATRSSVSDTNPPYSNLYPFLDLPGVGVAFKLVQALQTRLEGLPIGQEKWLLDLVALGTVCDVVTLVDENRTHVYWGLKVLQQTRRPGLRALMAVAGVTPQTLNARSLGFALGPRMNAAGRLETAQHALDMLRATQGMAALEKAQLLDDMNRARRLEQDKIFKEALVQAEQYADDPVLVVSSPGWSHGIIGIVAAKLLEKFGKPTFVLEENVNAAEHEHSVRASGGGDEASNSFRSESEGLSPPEKTEMGEESKGSARSYGDFSAADAIRASDDIITKGGGHKLAAGVTIPTANIGAFRARVNEFYRQQKLRLPEQQQTLLPRADASARLADVSEDLIAQIATLEPFGNGNPQPVLKTNNLLVQNVRRMGAEGQHVKLTLADGDTTMDFLAFSAPAHFFVEPGDHVTVWYQPDVNEWRGTRSVEGRLLHLEIA